MSRFFRGVTVVAMLSATLAVGAASAPTAQAAAAFDWSAPTLLLGDGLHWPGTYL
jgi:hypothetical protein